MLLAVALYDVFQVVLSVKVHTTLSIDVNVVIQLITKLLRRY